MLLRARGGESAGDREQHRLLPLRQFRHRRRLHLAGRVQVGEGGLRELVADGDGGGDGGGGESEWLGVAAGGESERGEFGRQGYGWEERGSGEGGRDEPGQCNGCGHGEVSY